MFDNGIETERKIRDENVMLQGHAAGWQHENAVGPGFYEYLRVGVIQADDVASERDGRVDQVPVVLHLQYRLSVFDDPHFAQSHGAIEILYV